MCLIVNINMHKQVFKHIYCCDNLKGYSSCVMLQIPSLSIVKFSYTSESYILSEKN